MEILWKQKSWAMTLLPSCAASPQHPRVAWKCMHSPLVLCDTIAGVYGNQSTANSFESLPQKERRGRQMSFLRLLHRSYFLDHADNE